MKFQFFTIPARNPAQAQDGLNRFCNSERVVNVEKAFVPNNDQSFWSVCVTYLNGSSEKECQPKSRVDYREVLSDRDFAVFVKLRTLRKTLAEKEGIPLYGIFSNEQLAIMVRQRVMTRSALAAIEGVGKGRLEKYGEAFLKVLKTECDQLRNNGQDGNKH